MHLRKKKRWPELEQHILYERLSGEAIEYVQKILKRRWFELENILYDRTLPDEYFQPYYENMLREIGYPVDED